MVRPVVCKIGFANPLVRTAPSQLVFQIQFVRAVRTVLNKSGFQIQLVHTVRPVVHKIGFTKAMVRTVSLQLRLRGCEI